MFFRRISMLQFFLPPPSNNWNRESVGTGIKEQNQNCLKLKGYNNLISISISLPKKTVHTVLVLVQDLGLYLWAWRHWRQRLRAMQSSAHGPFNSLCDWFPTRLLLGAAIERACAAQPGSKLPWADSLPQQTDLPAGFADANRLVLVVCFSHGIRLSEEVHPVDGYAVFILQSGGSSSVGIHR